jgi:hypothetical protein
MTTPRKLHNIPIPIPRHSALPGLVVAWKPYHFWPSRQYAESMARPYRKVLDCGALSQISPSQYPSHRRSVPPQRAACGAPAVVATPLGGRRCSSFHSSRGGVEGHAGLDGQVAEARLNVRRGGLGRCLCLRATGYGHASTEAPQVKSRSDGAGFVATGLSPAGIESGPRETPSHPLVCS